jgi:hypothetical protein
MDCGMESELDEYREQIENWQENICERIFSDSDNDSCEKE